VGVSQAKNYMTSELLILRSLNSTRNTVVLEILLIGSQVYFSCIR